MEFFYGTFHTTGGESHPVEIKITLYHLELKTDHHTQFNWNTDHLKSEAFNGKIRIQHADGMYVECSQPGFKEKLIEFHPKTNLNPHVKYQFSSPPFGKIGLAIIGLVVVGFAFYWWGIPAIGNLIGNNLPVSMEKQAGQEMFNQMKGQWKIDEERSKAVQAFFERMEDKSAYDFHIIVVKDDVINAFAMPGGYIVVYDALLKKIDRYEELAGLLAHESSHVQYRHTSRTLCTTLANYLFISAIIGDISGVVAILVQNADQIKSLSYSRDLETEADLKGLELMYRHQLNPQGMLGLMEALKGEGEETGQSMPEFSSTHPLPDSRITYIKDYIKAHPIVAKKDTVMEGLWEKIKL
jgi:Zn-dependent protease with chaperone function